MSVLLLAALVVLVIGLAWMDVEIGTIRQYETTRVRRVEVPAHYRGLAPGWPPANPAATPIRPDYTEGDL